MENSKLEKEIGAIAARNHVILQGHIHLARNTQGIVFAHYCKSTLFYHDFFRVTRDTFSVNRMAKRNVKQIKSLLKKQGYQKVWSKGVFAIYGDLRPLAVLAGFGSWGDSGLIVNETYGSDFLLSAVFFR